MSDPPPFPDGSADQESANTCGAAKEDPSHFALDVYKKACRKWNAPQAHNQANYRAMHAQLPLVTTYTSIALNDTPRLVYFVRHFTGLQCCCNYKPLQLPALNDTTSLNVQKIILGFSHFVIIKLFFSCQNMCLSQDARKYQQKKQKVLLATGVQKPHDIAVAGIW